MIISQLSEKSTRLQDAESTITVLRRACEKLKSMNEELLRDQKVLNDRLDESDVKLTVRIFHKPHASALGGH